MAIEQLTLISVAGPVRKVNKTLIKCCESGYFHINPPPNISGSHLEAKSLKDKGLYERMIKRCRSIADTLGITLDENASYDSVEFNVSVDFKKYLDGIDEKYNAMLDKKAELTSSIKSHHAIYTNLCQFADFNASFEDIFACQYVKIRFGRIPTGNMRKLDFYKDRPFCFFPFKTEQEYTWCLYLAPKSKKSETDYLFTSLDFERVILPDYLNGSSSEASERLLSTISEEGEQLEELEQKLKQAAKDEAARLSSVYAKLIAIDNSYELRGNVLVVENRFHFSGYIPSDKEKEFRAAMPEEVEFTTVAAKDDAEAPVKLKNNWLVRPFEMFVKMYGLPAAGGIDPTPIVAVTYILLYGIMFADLGQGLLIFLLGLLLTKFTKIKLAPIMTRIGLSSAVFGTLYGSVFGNEELITPFFKFPKVYTLLGYNSPPEDIFAVSSMLLIAAILIGVTLVLVSMVLNMIVCLRAKDMENGLFGSSGLLGFIFYAALIVGVGGNFIGLDLLHVWYVLPLIVLPLVLMFFKEPLLEAAGAKREEKTGKGNIDTGLKKRFASIFAGQQDKKKKSVGNFIIEGIIELFETCLTYLTNTMSFLRIGGFILSHAGLMLVVNVLAEMNAGGVGYYIVLVIGNLFVTGIEGFLVGIQVLRLEFYELFSRFFRGGGKPFNPVDVTRLDA